jgi:hypothetical protein
MSKTKTSVLIIIALMLSPTLAFPTASAKPQSQKPEIAWVVNQASYKEAIATVNGTEFYLTASLSGDVWEITTINGVGQDSNWIQLQVWIPRPPYPWWIPMGNVPAFRMHLDGPTAINTGTALAVAAVLLGVCGGEAGIVAGIVLGIMVVGYGSMWSSDHASDNSFDLWGPYDWYNVLLCASGLGVYFSTLCYWWFAYLRVVPWVIGTHSYWG